MKIEVMQSLPGSLTLLATDLIFGAFPVAFLGYSNVSGNMFGYGLGLLFIAGVMFKGG